MSVPILYETGTTDFWNMGLGPLSDTTAATVTEERNGEFVLDMKYPIDGTRADELKSKRIIVADAGHKLKQQQFDITTVQRTLNEIIVHAEHVSYRSSRYPLQPTFNVTGSADVVLNQWRASIVVDNNITTDSDISSTNTVTWSVDKVGNARLALGGVEGSILDVFGGEYRFDNEHVSLLNHRGSVVNTLLAYGRNITDFNQEEAIDSTYTSIYPYALETSTTDSTSTIVTLPEFIVDGAYVDNFPQRRVATVDLSDKFDSEKNPVTVDKLRDAAKTYVKANNVGVPTVTTKISFIDLSKSVNYSDLAPLETVDLCDEVPFWFSKYNIKTTAKVSRTTWNVITDSYDSIELGDLAATLNDSIKSIATSSASSTAKKTTLTFLQGANGIDGNFYTDGTTDQPVANKIGDRWYEHDGKDITMYIWDGTTWVRTASTKDLNEVAKQIEKATADLPQMKIDIQTSLAKAGEAANNFNNISATVQAANNLAATAKTDAANALDAITLIKSDTANAVANAAEALNLAKTTDANYTKISTQLDEVNGTMSTLATNQRVDTINNTVTTVKSDLSQAVGQLSLKADQVTVTGISDKLNNLSVGGRNLYLNTTDFSNANSVWDRYDSWTPVTEKYNGLTVMQADADWNGLSQFIAVKKGEMYTFSTYARFTSGAGNAQIYWQLNQSVEGSSGQYATATTGPTSTLVSLTNGWQRVSSTVTILTDGYIRPRTERTTATTNVLQVAGLKLERGNMATDHSPAPEDDANLISNLKAVVTKTSANLDITNQQLALKADKTVTDGINNTINDLSAEQKVQAGQISTMATKTYVDTSTAGLATESYVGAQIKVSATEIGQTVSAVQNQLNTLDGTNLLLNTYDYTGWGWSGSVLTDTFNGTKIFHTISQWGGPKYHLTDLNSRGVINTTDSFVFSTWVRNTSTVDNIQISLYCSSGTTNAITSNGVTGVTLKANSGWVRTFVAFKFTNMTLDATLRFEPRQVPTGGAIEFACQKLERGLVPMGYSPAPEDTATVTALTNVSQTMDAIKLMATNNQNDLTTLTVKVNGWQSTVSSQILGVQNTQTSLANQYTSLITGIGQTNLVYNSTFSNSAEGWNCAGDWYSTSSPWGDTATSTGGYAINVTTDSGTGWHFMTSKDFSVDVNTMYSVSARAVVADNGKTPVQIQAGIEFMADGKRTSYWPVNIDVTKKQQGQTVVKNSIKPDANAKTAHFIFTMQGNGYVQFKQPMLAAAATIGPYANDSVGSSQFTQLQNSIDLAVSKGDVIGRINVQAGKTLIQNNTLYLDADTVAFSGKAFIPSAAIKSLSVDLLKGQTINGTTMNVINVNGANIVSGSITADKLASNAITVGLQKFSSTLKITPTSITINNGSNTVFTMNQTGIHVWDPTVNKEAGLIGTVEDVNHKDVYGLSFGLDHDAHTMTWGYEDSAGSGIYNAKMQWIDTYGAGKLGIKQGFHFTNDVHFNSGSSSYNATNIVKSVSAIAGLGTAYIPTAVDSNGNITSMTRVTL